MVEPISLNRGEGLMAMSNGVVGGGESEGEGGGGRRVNEQTSTVDVIDV